MKKEKLVLVGGGGHCKSCIDVIELENKWEIYGIIDVNENVGNRILGYKVIGTDQDIPEISKKISNFFITIGHIKDCNKRVQLYTMLKDMGLIIPVIISPRAYVSKHVKLGEGTIVMHNAFINAASCIGKMCILNSGAIVEHDNQIGNFCHISINSVLGGTVSVGDYCFIGGGAFIYNDVSIKEKTIIRAGTIVSKDVV